MGDIEWTDCTWNPAIGCSRISPGCHNCWAEKMAARLSRTGTAPQYAEVAFSGPGGCEAARCERHGEFIGDHGCGRAVLTGSSYAEHIMSCPTSREQHGVGNPPSGMVGWGDDGYPPWEAPAGQRPQCWHAAKQNRHGGQRTGWHPEWSGRTAASTDARAISPTFAAVSVRTRSRG